MKSLKLTLLILGLLFTFVLNAKIYSDKDSFETNIAIGERILSDSPYLFMVPKSVYSKAPINDTGAMIFDFTHKDSGAENSQKLGLKLFIAEESLSKRKEVSEKLKKSGFVKDGDILLTYHPEWGYTGAYTSLMTGISHAGMAYTEGDKILNIDMPLNKEMNYDIRNNGKSLLSSDHYVKHTKFVHIVRPILKDVIIPERDAEGKIVKNENDETVYEKISKEKQIKNLKDWAKVFEGQVAGLGTSSIYRNKTIFNSSYLAPAYMLHGKKDAKGNPDYTLHVMDLARIAKGGVIQNGYINPKTGQGAPVLPLFCSDFIWSMQSLKTCDPNNSLAEVNNCKRDDKVQPAFLPMGLVGDPSSGSYVPGLTDAAYLTLKALNIKDPELIKKKVKEIFGGPNGAPARTMRNVSSGHRGAAKDIKEKDPKLYPALEEYLNVQLVGELTGDPQLLGAAAQIRKALNAGDMPKNYSPTAFLIQALMPASPQKKFEYVGTVAYLSDAEMSALKSALKKDESGDQVIEAPTLSIAFGGPAQSFIDVLGLEGSDAQAVAHCSRSHSVNADYGLMHPVWGYADCQPVRKALVAKGLNWREFTENGSL